MLYNTLLRGWECSMSSALRSDLSVRAQHKQGLQVTVEETWGFKVLILEHFHFMPHNTEVEEVRKLFTFVKAIKRCKNTVTSKSPALKLL